jgi:hypothetical protein
MAPFQFILGMAVTSILAALDVEFWGVIMSWIDLSATKVGFMSTVGRGLRYDIVYAVIAVVCSYGGWQLGGYVTFARVGYVVGTAAAAFQLATTAYNVMDDYPRQMLVVRFVAAMPPSILIGCAVSAIAEAARMSVKPKMMSVKPESTTMSVKPEMMAVVPQAGSTRSEAVSFNNVTMRGNTINGVVYRYGSAKPRDRRFVAEDREAYGRTHTALTN